MSEIQRQSETRINCD